MALSKSLVSWYVIISDSAVVVSYLNVLSHLRFNVIRTSLWKNLFLLCLSYCSSQDGKANQTGYNENDKTICKRQFSWGKQKAAPLLILLCSSKHGMGLDWLHGDLSNTPESRDRYSWQELPGLIQQGTRSTTTMIFLHCYCCCPSLFSSTGSACQPRYVWSNWAAGTNIRLLFFPRAAASWLGRCMHAECGVCKGTGTHSLCNIWKDREKCPRFSWSATSQPDTTVSAGWLLSSSGVIAPHLFAFLLGL